MTVYVDMISPEKGRGVFAAKDFKAGDTIEVCPVIVIPTNQLKLMDDSVMSSYVFEWTEMPETYAIVLGYGSLYNHSSDPNSEFDTDYEKNTMVFTALRDIKRGEEICTDYQWELEEESTPEWFKRLSKEEQNRNRNPHDNQHF